MAHKVHSKSKMRWPQQKLACESQVPDIRDEGDGQDSVNTYGHNTKEWRNSEYNLADVKRNVCEISRIYHPYDEQRLSE